MIFEIQVQKIYLEPAIRYTGSIQHLNRFQGHYARPAGQTDSLEMSLDKHYTALVPGLGIRRNTDKMQLMLQVDYSLSRLNTSSDGLSVRDDEYAELLPSGNFEYTFGTGRRFSMRYSTHFTAPSVNQLIPVINNMNPLFIINGNPMLEPEKRQQLSTHLFIFDQFSFTTLLASVSAEHTKNRINWARNVDENLVQEIMPVNSPYGTDLNGTIDFSRPIRKLGIKLNLFLRESYSRGVAPVNQVDNKYSSLTHDLVLTLDNRKKQKWDLSAGIGARLTDSRYSIQESLNDQYFDINWFGEVAFTPNTSWDYSFSADVINYNQRSFGASVLVPYLESEINFHFPASKRATLSFRVNDILNRDTGIQRISELNYLRETRRNVIGRYFMLSLKYRLNKSDGGNNGLHVEVKGRRR